MTLADIHKLLGDKVTQLTKKGFTYFFSQSKWYKINDEKGFVIAWPANGIGEKIEIKTLEDLNKIL